MAIDSRLSRKFGVTHDPPHKYASIASDRARLIVDYTSTVGGCFSSAKDSGQREDTLTVSQRARPTLCFSLLAFSSSANIPLLWRAFRAERKRARTRAKGREGERARSLIVDDRIGSLNFKISNRVNAGTSDDYITPVSRLPRDMPSQCPLNDPRRGHFSFLGH